MSPDLARLFCRTSVSRDVLLISVHVPMLFISPKRKGERTKLGALGCGTSVTESLVSGYSWVWLARVNISRHNGTRWYVTNSAWMRRKSQPRNMRIGDCIVPWQIGADRHTHFHRCKLDFTATNFTRVSTNIIVIIISWNQFTLKIWWSLHNISIKKIQWQTIGTRCLFFLFFFIMNLWNFIHIHTHICRVPMKSHMTMPQVQQS